MGHKEVSVFTLPYRSKINNNINIQPVAARWKDVFRVHSALRGLPWYGTQTPSPQECQFGVPEKQWPAKVWREFVVEPSILRPTTQCSAFSTIHLKEVIRLGGAIKVFCILNNQHLTMPTKEPYKPYKNIHKGWPNVESSHNSLYRSPTFHALRWIKGLWLSRMISLWNPWRRFSLR